MRLRSLLFVPGDRPDRMAKANLAGADALILDLEDGVVRGAKALARAAIGDFAAQPRVQPLFVRINPLHSPEADSDIALVWSARPDGVVLPKADASTIAALADRLPREAPILPIAAETPEGVLGLGRLAQDGHRLCGVTWGAEDLAASVGAAGPRLPSGALSAPFELARSLTLFAAHALGAPPIETVFANFRDLDGLAICAAAARRDGFAGMMAIHPGQVPVINAAFTPSRAEVEEARAILDAFAAQPQAGALSLHGRMIDAPHRSLARKILAQAGDAAAL